MGRSTLAEWRRKRDEQLVRRPRRQTDPIADLVEGARSIMAHVYGLGALSASKPLFQSGRFKSAAGLDLDWKIECDALTNEDWKCIAAVGAHALPQFGSVAGVPTGGHRLAKAFEPYRVDGVSRMLIVDDVWTTGKSMMACVNGIEGIGDWCGFVAFARGKLAPNVTCFAQINSN